MNTNSAPTPTPPDGKGDAAGRNGNAFAPPRLHAPSSILRRIVRRIISGVLFILPIVLTVGVIYWVYSILDTYLIGRVAEWIVWTIPHNTDNEYLKFVENYEKYVAPPVTLLVVLVLLYLMGYLFQTRVNGWIDWLFKHIPGISTLYRAIRDVATAFQGPQGLRNISTVVLVPFPHPGARMTGYLMGETADASSGEKLCCVYIPIGVFPPLGYTLMFPAADVTVTDWEPAAVWKVLLSGGLTLPPSVPYRQPATPAASAETAESEQPAER